MKKFVVYVFVLLVFLGSCSSLNNIAPGYAQAFNAIKVLYTGYENTISNEMIESIPYSSALLKIGNGPTGLIILESIQNNIETWVSADNVYIQIENGKIIKTAGLNNNLISTVGAKNFSKGLQDNSVNSYLSYLSYDKPKLNNLILTNKLIKKGIQEVELLSGLKRLTLYEESFENDYLNWQGVNQYWLDETGYILKSKQYISTKLPLIEIEVTKKPAL